MIRYSKADENWLIKVCYRDLDVSSNIIKEGIMSTQVKPNAWLTEVMRILQAYPFLEGLEMSQFFMTRHVPVFVPILKLISTAARIAVMTRAQTAQCKLDGSVSLYTTERPKQEYTVGKYGYSDDGLALEFVNIHYSIDFYSRDHEKFADKIDGRLYSDKDKFIIGDIPQGCAYCIIEVHIEHLCRLPPPDGNSMQLHSERRFSELIVIAD